MGKYRQKLDKVALGSFFSGVLYRGGAGYFQNAIQQCDNLAQFQFGRYHYANGDVNGIYGGTNFHDTAYRSYQQELL